MKTKKQYIQPLIVTDAIDSDFSLQMDSSAAAPRPGRYGSKRSGYYDDEYEEE
ncbi:MAG: hypothetical protein LBN23_01320 [Paludibacter sp.]|jgi:hypothetical protein|nr:hypothetical protein [Paludibacter sp.]